jgi:chemotaxis protein methyltransferase CheR
MEMNKFSEAGKSLMKILYLDPAYVPAHFMLGNINRINNNVETSIKHFTKAYRLLEKEKDEKIL